MAETRKINAMPLGLFGFGFTTVLLNLHNIGLFAMSPVIMAMGIVFGGFAQIIAGKIEFEQENNFGGIVFISYGVFWWSLVLIWLMPVWGLVDSASPVAMGYYLVMWAILTAIFFLQTLNGHLVGKLVFMSLILLFVLLAIADFTGSAKLKIFAGIVGLICGSLAIYEGTAVMTNTKYGKNIFPLG